MGQVTLDDFRDVLRGLAKDKERCTLVGGLAVALWAENYDVRSEVWPLLSKDLDVRGDRIAARAIGVALRDQGHSVPMLTAVKRKVPPGQGRAFVLQIEMVKIGSTTVEVLERLPVLDPPNPDDDPSTPVNGLTLEVRGIQVLDPISLLICKAAAWNERKHKEGYNDATHIAMLETIVPAFVKEARERGVDVSDRLAQLREVVKTYPLPVGAAFWEALG